MPSADLFLQLLEEKELVSAEVLQAARREIQRSSPPPDAVHISLWLVQGHHITASQAERLLAAAAEKADVAGPKPPVPSVRQTSNHTPKVGWSLTYVPAKSPTAASATSADDLELASLEEERGNKSATTKPARPGSAAAKGLRCGKSSRQARAAESQDKKSPAAVASREPGQEAPAAKIGGELESLEDTMKGPLDALIESEALAAGPFDDPTAGPQLNPAAPKKFKLRRFLKNLFRRNKSKVVRIKAADPRQVKLVLISWGVAVAALIGTADRLLGLLAAQFDGNSAESRGGGEGGRLRPGHRRLR